MKMYLNVDVNKIAIIMAEKKLLMKDIPVSARQAIKTGGRMKPRTVGSLAESLGVTVDEIIKKEGS